VKKVAFVTTNDGAPSGGSELLWSESALLMRQQGYSVSVRVKEWDPVPEHVSLLKNAGCSIASSGRRTILTRVIGKNDPMSSCQDWLKEYRPDFVVISLGIGMQGLEWMEACQSLKMSYVLLVHLASEHNWQRDGQAERFGHGYSSAVKCFFVSEHNRLMIEAMMGLRLRNVEIVRNPYKIPYDAPFEWPEHRNGFRLASVANLNVCHKGQDILFQVLRQEKWKNRHLTVDLYGSGPHAKTLQKLKVLWGLENVSLVGYLDNISDVWKTHHGLLLPSRMEGLPISLVEAMLAGRISVVTDVGGNLEVVDDEVHGFVAAAPTVKSFDEALERAWNRRSDWENIGTSAMARIKSLVSEHPAKDFVNKIESLF